MPVPYGVEKYDLKKINGWKPGLAGEAASFGEASRQRYSAGRQGTPGPAESMLRRESPPIAL